MIVRPALPGDPIRAHVRAIYEEFGLQFDPEFEDDLEDVPTHYAQGAMWVAEDGGRLLACGGVVAGGGARVIKRIYVAREARRHGLARELLRRGCAWGDFNRTELWSDVRFRDAHRMYLSEGFHRGHARVLADPDRSVERFFFR